jgi:glycerophosphoryl diester phosphodiesterase
MSTIRPLPIAVPAPFRIIAHRGASAYAPENTLAAFALAQQMGVREVELDTQLTTDGMVALCHDTTLARFGHGAQVVEEMAWSDLADLDMGSWFSPFLYGGERMVHLGQLFQRFGRGLIYHIELKGQTPGLAAAVHALINEFDLASSCFVTSFSYDLLVAMRQESADLRLGWLVREIDEDMLAKAAAIDLYQLCPQAKNVTPIMVAAARSVMTEVRAWGLLGERINTQAADIISLIEQVLESGCDGMTINWPDWVSH